MNGSSKVAFAFLVIRRRVDSLVKQISSSLLFNLIRSLCSQLDRSKLIIAGRVCHRPGKFVCKRQRFSYFISRPELRVHEFDWARAWVGAVRVIL